VLAGLLTAQVPSPPTIKIDETLALVSTPVYIPTFKLAFGREPGFEPRRTGSLVEEAPLQEGEAEPRTGGVTAATVPLYTVPVNDDPQQDVETSIISTLTSNSASVGYIKRSDTGVFRNYVGFTSDFTAWTNTLLPIPAGYTQSADPLQHNNAFDTGIAPRRTYLTGIVYNGAATVVPNAIGVWRSDNGGASWAGPVLVATNSDPAFFLDKPDIEVSWYSGTRGRAYVAHVRVNNTNPALTRIYVSRSENGGVSFSVPVWVANTEGRFQGPQMLASTVGTRIYVIWTDFTNPANERLLMSWSDNQGGSFTAPEVVATGNFLTGAPADFLNGGVRAVTLSMARYNGVRNAIGVVWHERAADGSTDIYFAAKTSSGWTAKKRINPVTTNDQFMPGIDYEPSGNYLVTYYDRSGDPTNTRYREKWVKIDHLGNILESGEVAGGFESDPTQFINQFIGDYQDIWWWDFTDMLGDRFNAAWVGRPSTRVNPYVSGLQ
jgi:hypothetical protein